MPFAIFIIWFVIVLGIVYIYFKHNICKSNTFLNMASIVCVSYILYNTQHNDIFDIVLYGEPVFCIFSVFISSYSFQHHIPFIRMTSSWFSSTTNSDAVIVSPKKFGAVSSSSGIYPSLPKSSTYRISTVPP